MTFYFTFVNSIWFFEILDSENLSKSEIEEQKAVIEKLKEDADEDSDSSSVPEAYKKIGKAKIIQNLHQIEAENDKLKDELKDAEEKLEAQEKKLQSIHLEFSQLTQLYEELTVTHADAVKVGEARSGQLQILKNDYDEKIDLEMCERAKS